MITNSKINIMVSSKVGWLTEYYKNKFNISDVQAYIYVRDSGIIDILKDKKYKLYLEAVDLVRDAIDVFYAYGKEKMMKYIINNI